MGDANRLINLLTAALAMVLLLAFGTALVMAWHEAERIGFWKSLLSRLFTGENLLLILAVVFVRSGYFKGFLDT